MTINGIEITSKEQLEQIITQMPENIQVFLRNIYNSTSNNG